MPLDDLVPERRERLVAGIRAALEGVTPGSRTAVRGSLASGTADRYSDIDLTWVVPDRSLEAAVGSAGPGLHPVRPVFSVRTDPGFARSDRRRLLFVRLAGVPLFWRIDLDVRARTVAADDSYDRDNPAARDDAGWSRPASAVENAVAALKATARGRAGDAQALLHRGYDRIGLRLPAAAEPYAAITGLAGACAEREPRLTGLAAQVREVARALAGHEIS